MSAPSAKKKTVVSKLPVGFKPEAPPLVPAEELIIDPAVIAPGPSIGSDELIFRTILPSAIGPVLLWAAPISLISQTLWALEMVRWVVWTGEHWVLQMARVHGLISAVTIWNPFTFFAWGFGGWAAAAGKVLFHLTGAPQPASVGTVVWSAFLCLLIWLVVLFAGVVREYVE